MYGPPPHTQRRPIQRTPIRISHRNIINPTVQTLPMKHMRRCTPRENQPCALIHRELEATDWALTAERLERAILSAVLVERDTTTRSG
jgi:hypothetical protein